MRITGPEFKVAVKLAGGPSEVAKLLGMSRDTVHRYQREGVHEEAEPVVRHRMKSFLPGEDPNPLAQYSDLQLLAEFLRRLSVAQRANDETAISSDLTDSDTVSQPLGPADLIGGWPPKE